MPGTPGDLACGGLALDQRERRLQRIDMPNGFASFEQRYVEIADPSETVLCPGRSAAPFRSMNPPRAFRFHRANELVEINALNAQPPQRSVAFPPNRIRLKDSSRRSHRIVRIPDQSALGEDQWALGWRPFKQQAADHFFGMTEPVHCGRIYPIHPELQCVTHGRQRNSIVWGPQPPPIAQAPNPVLMIKTPLEPSGRCGRFMTRSSG